jgi:peroxiredoxin
MGTASHEFEIPPLPGGRSDEPLDVGSLELKLVTRLQVGDPAPAFAARTVDGKPLALADYKGKYVLLDFWATWCGPCRGETPNLKTVYDTFGKDERFAMLGLSLDAKTDEPKAYAKEHGLGWSQGFLGDWSSTDVPERYGVRGIPSIWLIGPDGKVVAKDLRGDKIKAAVAEALARKP